MNMFGNAKVHLLQFIKGISAYYLGTYCCFWVSQIKELGNAWDWSFKINGNDLSFYLKTAAGTIASVSTPYTNAPINQWTHIAATYDNSALTLYINGTLVGTAPLSGSLGNNSSIPITLGGNPLGGWNFQGQIDEVRIWSAARTQAQIQEGMGPAKSFSSSILCYLKMDNGIPNANNTGLTTATAAHFGLNGTLMNFGLTGNTSNWVARSPYLTANATSITTNAATLNANLLQAGTSPILEKGFIWSEADTPLSLTSGTKVISSGTAMGAFSTNLTGLSPDKAYTYCAYAISAEGNTLSPSTAFTTTSVWGNALSFDGVDDYVQLPAANYFGNADFTIESWIYPRSFGTFSRLMDFGSGAGNNNVLITYAGNGSSPYPIFQVRDGSNIIFAITSSIPLVANQWAHIAATFYSNVANLYINGQFAGRAVFLETIPNISLSNCYIGRSNWAQDSYSDVIIDEFRIWSIARTQAEIQAGMSPSNVTATSPNMICYLKMDNGVPNETNSWVTIAPDAFSSGYNGTLTNFTLTGNTSNWVAHSPYLNSNPTISAMTSNSATATANLIQPGTGTILEKGFIWANGNTVPSFAVGTKIAVTGTSTGAYAAVLTGLTVGQTYTVLAYARSVDGYSYSNPTTFVLDPCSSPPPLNAILVSNIGDTTATISWTSFAPSTDWVVALSGLGVTNPILTGNSASGSASVTGLSVGLNYDVFVRGNCGAAQSMWQGPVTFQTTSSPSFTSSTPANDAYVQLNWILRPLPCLVNNGTPYSQGIYVKLTDQATGQVLKQEPITDLTPFIGAQQPTFNYVAGDSVNFKTCSINNTSNWRNYPSSTWTIETWVKGNINASNAEIFKSVVSSGYLATGVIIKITGTVISIQRNNTTHNLITPFPLGKWKHLAFTYNGGTIALFIDGVKKEEKNIINLTLTGTVSATYSVANNFRNIQMGEIRYWNRVRTDVEIAHNRWNTSFNALGQNNLLLHLRWNTNNAAPVDLATAYDGQNNTVTYSGTGTLQTLPYITTPDYTPITGSYRHYVGPSKTKSYKLEVFQIGSGAAIPTCTNLTASGSTIAFQQPINLTATTTLLDRVRLQWTNKSKLSETFKIFRAGVLRSVIAGSDKIDSVFVWEDKYSADDSLSIVNGTSYNYCIETYSNTLGVAYTPQACKTGNTFNLTFAATDGSPSNKVNLSWANVASYNYNIQIKRDGALIATLPANTVTYADANPIYGKVSKYEIVLVNPNTAEIVVAKSDNGSVPARGSISGRVVTLNNNYAIKNVRVKLHSLVDTLVNLTTYTNYLGNFTFNNLYYEFNGQFKISVDYGNHVFVEPLKTVTLNDANFAVTNLEFLDSTGLTLSPTPLAVSNFVGTAVGNQDKVNFSWNASLSAGDTIVYDIYREATRIATLTNLTNVLSFADLTGEPNVSYKYKLNAYKVKNGLITAISLADTVLFPQVTSATTFTATANTSSGVVNMAWTHSSANYNGFRIYRNGKKIAEIPAGTLSYIDIDAKPGTTATYILKAKRFVNNITFESLAKTVSNVNIPALPAVTGVTATANTTRNSILISWTIPAALNATYNYSGFRVYRRLSSASAASDVYIGQLPKGINPAYEDKTAIPSTAYTYTVKGYLRLSDNIIGESAGASANATCPVVTPITGLTATTTLTGQIALSWNAIASTVRNIDGIIVLKGTDTLAVLPYNTPAYRIYTNSTTLTAYSVRTFRNVAGIKRLSAALSASGKAATSTNTLEFVTNASATQNLANHIRLSWEYPSYVLSTFNIYRDNVLISTLPTESRVYIDNEAVAGATHLYQIEAVNGSSVSQKVGAQGRLRSIRELNGMVYSTADKYGVPNVDVYVSGIGYTGHTKTDSSGFYVFSGLPETVSTALTVFVDGYGTNYTTTFGTATQTFTIAAGTNVYTKNFGSTYNPAISDTLAPTRPMNIIATPNSARRRVAITWAPSNTYYDGFEVYRANILLANVKKGENLVAYDTTGYPGISYTYQIRSYQYTSAANKYSAFYSTTGTYPVLEAPVYLTATPNLALNTLKLTWSHNWDNHTKYEIRRNDSLLASVNSKSLLEYVDNTGVPGQQYVYTVTSVMVVGSQTHYSNVASVSVQYPTVAEVNNFTATIPTSSTSYATPCSSNVNQDRNFLDLNWTYNNNAEVKGFRIYRDQTLLATIPKTDVGAWSNALRFDGIDDYFTIGTTNTFNSSLTNKITVEAWIKPDKINSVAVLIQLSGFMIYMLPNGELVISIYGNSVSQDAFIPNTGIMAGRWAHIAVSYNGSFVILYVNGKQVGMNSMVGNITPEGIVPVIGRFTPGYYNFAGAIDELRIWNVVRTAAQIKSGMASSVPTSSTGLLAYYPFDQGIAEGANLTINTVTDTKSGNDGTLTNFALTGNTSNWVEHNSFSYRDYEGTPSDLTPYTVKTILERNGVNYYSQGITINQTYPNLATPQNVTTKDTLGMKQISWTYPDGGATGFYIVRGTTVIDTVAADSMTQTKFLYRDKSGISGNSYNYTIKTYSKRNGVTYFANDYTCLTGLVYPKPLTPTNLVASDSTYPSYVKITWNYPQGTDITAFAIFCDGIQIGTVAGGIKEYYHLTPPVNFNINAKAGGDYSVKAYKTAIFQSTSYTNYSDFSNIDRGTAQYDASATIFMLDAVTASNGTLNGQTRIDWIYDATPLLMLGFRIYRDGILIQTASVGDRYFYDVNGVAGKHYVYEVSAYTSLGDQLRKSTVGWSKPDGYMEGKVVTLMGNGGVGGVNIQAVSTIEGNDYIYNAVTDVNGNYAISNVYYGDTINSFMLTAKYGDHVFLTNPIYTTLSPQNKSRNTLYFSDKTAYVISGTVGRRGLSCYLDSVRVYGEYIMADSSVEMFTQDAYTKPDGSYSLNINPFKQNAIGMRVNIENTRILLSSNGADTLHFKFAALQTPIFPSLANFSQNTTLNFEDTLTYPVRLELLSACRNAITGGNFKIRVRSKDDCFDKIFTTDLNGKVTANLPPLAYVMNVDGVANNSAANQLLVNYLRYRPQTLDIYSLYIDTTYHATAYVLDSLTHQEFVYHRPPSITVLGGFDKYMCDNPNNPAIITQNNKYSLKFQVGEIFNNSSCVVKTGYLVLKNAASAKERDTVYVNRQTGDVETYTFIAGNPNLVAPHQHTMTIEYRTDIGELIATKTMSIIVEGAASLPGADIIVDLGNGAVQLPLFTLRDPMGDGSSSSISTGSTISRSFSLSTDFAVSLGVTSDLKFTAPVGPKIQIALKSGGGYGYSKDWSLTATANEEISTSNASWHVGPKHDVIVGAGVALQYGLVQEIKVSGCNNITKTQKLGFAPHSVQTTWNYTVAQIETLIAEYQSKIGLVEAGTLVLEEGGQSLSKAAAIQRLKTYAYNWEKILVYHNKETLPWYNLCQSPVSEIPEPYKSHANEWRAAFCPLVGSYDGNGNFNPKDKIVWNQELVTAYNNAMSAIRKLNEDYLDMDIQELPNWAYYQGALSEPAKFIDEAYVNQHDLEAKNLTFGSGLSITHSLESAAASSFTHSGKASLSLSAWYGFGLKTGALVGFGFQTQLVEGDAYIGPTFSFDWNFSTDQNKAREETNNISYTLSDDDDFDQFSVTVIQGIDPHQTPYFSLLGGRSSCPQEAGTLYLDNPSMNVWDPVTESTSKEGTANFVEPDEPAVMYLQVSNQNPFGNSRSVAITLDPFTNLDGAKVTIAGTPMISGQKVVLSLAPNEPIIVPVSIERGLWAYDYDSLKLYIKPYCGPVNDDNNGENSMVGNSPFNTSVTLNVHFKNECSPITIAEPDGYWTVLKQNVNDPNSREVLPIRLMDYAPSNENLLDVHLEYRRKGNGLTWHQIPDSELSPELLGDWNEENFLASQVPYYMYSWDITGDYQTYPDGEYEVRAVAECGLSGHVYSNIIKGAIERKTNLYGLPQPSDHVWTMGDEISVAFNLDIDCSAVADSNFVVHKLNDNNSFLPGTVTCANNKLIFSPELSLMPLFDGDTLEMVVGGVRTFNGNILDTVRWEFLVISRDLYVTKDSFEIELTQGQTADFATTLVNNVRTGQTLNYHIQNLAGAASWLSCSDSTGTVLFNSPKDVSFHINSKEMPVGSTTLNLDIFANGRLYENAIYVKVKVLPKGPDWTFDPSQYSQDMTLVANYNFNNTNLKSTDTTDLISVWIDNKLRGVANINKFTTTLYSAVISVYGNPSDFGKALKFRIWDASAGVEYDARPDANATISFAPDKIEGSVSSPRLLDVFTASDKVQYIPLNQGWTMFSVNTNRWNAPLNTAIASLRHPHDGDVIKTANKSAEYVSASNSWVSTNGLDSTNVHRGYQIYLQAADTLRITGSAAAISPIELNYGWNFVGYPPQTALGIDTAFAFLGQLDSVTLKTTAQNPTYSRNMVAIYDNGTWKYASNSDMDMLYPNFAYKMRVSSTGSQLYFDGANASQAPVTLLRTVQEVPLNLNKPEEWAVNAPSFEHNMLITGVIDYNKAENVNENSKIAAYVGEECRGVGELKYVKELKRYVTTMMVYSNGGEEEVSFYIYNADQNRGYEHHETLTFTPDALVGNYANPYHFSNVAPDNSFNGSVYPNPFNKGIELNLKSDKTQDYEVQLLDLTGRVLQKSKLSSENTNFTTSIKTADLDLVEGVYLLQVKGSLGKTLTFKVIHSKQ